MSVRRDAMVMTRKRPEQIPQKAIRQAEKVSAVDAKRAAASCEIGAVPMAPGFCEPVPIHSDGELSEDGTLLTATTLLAKEPVFRADMQAQVPPAACPTAEVIALSLI